MHIYEQEIKDGVSDLVLASNSLACESVALLCNPKEQNIDNLIKKISANANPDQFDLYYIKSVLVSTGWNKNDDVFSAEATWAARNTPEDKQFNFMHNENDIIGHITSSYVVDRDGNKIESDEAPEVFDIITEAVLYNSWTSPDNRERMQNIIAEIKEGKWFVSMECLFSGFDYALVGEDGNSKVLSRSEETSFLTKHLRAYGGTGEYQGYKVGRSLREISFSGKGLVEKPANPRSIIFNTSQAFDHDQKQVLDLNKGESNMSDTNVLEKQLADVRTELASALEENKAIRAQIEAAKDKEYAETIASLEEAAAAHAEVVKALEEKVQAHEATITSLTETLAAKDEEMQKKDEEMKNMKKKERDNARKASLIEAGFDEDVEESVALYDTIDDDTFASIVAMWKKKGKKDEEKMEENKAAEDATDSVEDTQAEAEEEVSEELFDGVQSTEATLIDASDDSDELEATRASVASWLETTLRK